MPCYELLFEETIDENYIDIIKEANMGCSTNITF